MADEDKDRHSRALESELVTDTDEKSKKPEMVRQFDHVAELIEYFSDPEAGGPLPPSRTIFSVQE